MKSKGVYHVSTRKAGARKLEGVIVDNVADAEEEVIGTIQGQTPGSAYEWRLAKALERAGWTFEFQVSVFGGRSTMGGQVIDFLVHTVPLPTPVFADGEHWHQGQLSAQDAFKRAFLEAQTRGTWNPPLSFFGLELHSIESALDAVVKRLGRI